MQKTKRLILFTIAFAFVALSGNTQVWGDGLCETTRIFDEGRLMVEYSLPNCTFENVYFCPTPPCGGDGEPHWQPADADEFWVCTGDPLPGFSNCSVGNCGPRASGCVFSNQWYYIAGRWFYRPED